MILRPLFTLWLCCMTFSTVSAKKSSSDKAADKRSKGITERTVPMRTHSIYAPYVDADLQNRWFDFGGSAIVDTSKHIRLTQDRQSQSGWLWSRLPLTPTSFEIEFEFRVDGKSNTIFGDGFAMWLTRSRAQTGPVFGSLDYWEGLGIFFDTYANSRHSYTFPEVLAMTNDGTKAYDHGRDGAGQEAGRCSIDFRRTEISAKGKLTYFKNQFLELQMQTEKWDRWETCFTIYNYTLPGSPYLGFSAHTGDVSDAHDIIQIATSNVVYHPPHPKRNQKSATRGWGFFSFLFSLMKWLLILVIIAVAAVAAKGWLAKRNAKRF